MAKQFQRLWESKLALSHYFNHWLIYKRSAVPEMGDRLATIVMGRKLGAAAPLLGGENRRSEPKQLQGTSTDMEWPVIASLIIALEGNG